MEHWLPLQDYPGYSASDLGRVRNDKRECVLAPKFDASGFTFVGLIRDGRQVQRGLARLVARSFVECPDAIPPFNTPIHLDGNKQDCRADNLMWRPRWFAQAYMRQMLDFDTEMNTRLIRKCHNGEVYKLYDLITTEGLLITQVIKSILGVGNVFPTMDTFEWA